MLAGAPVRNVHPSRDARVNNPTDFTDTDLRAGLGRMAPGSISQSHDLVRRFVDAVVRRTGVVRLPSLAGVVERALEAARGEWDAERVAEWFVLDPCLAARLLETSIDAVTPSEPFADSLAARIEKLGPGLTRTILVAAAAATVRPASEASNVLDISTFWSHSVRAALVSRTLAVAAGYSRPGEAYLAALLHDVGMLALANALPGTCDALLRVVSSADPGEARERAGRFGTVHAAIGAALLEGLRLPAPVCDAVLLHHAAFDELKGTHALVRILRSTEAICQKTASDSELGVAAELLGIPPSAVRRAVTDADLEFALVTKRLAPTAPGRKSEDEAHIAPGVVGSTPDSLVQHVLQVSAGTEASLQLSQSSDFAAVLEQTGRLLSAIAGLGRFALFAPERAGEPPQGWCVGPAGTQRLGIDLASADIPGLVARAYRDRKPLASRELPETIRLAGVDLQVARALRAESIIAFPLKGADDACLGVLVVGIADLAGAGPQDMLPMLQQLANALVKSLERLGAGARNKTQAQIAPVDALRAATRCLVHEARNPLAILKASVEVARRRAAEGEDISGELDVFADEIDRVNRIVSQIATADAPTEAEAGPVDVNRAIRQLLVVYEGPLFRGRGLAVELDLAESDPSIMGSGRLLKQVLLNLLKNASEAMEVGGAVEIATADLVNAEGRMMVEITIADSGRGMGPAAISRLFEPRSRGDAAQERGLGLVNTLQFVKEMGGHLSCRSWPEKGASFTILLPRVVDARAVRYRRTPNAGT